MPQSDTTHQADRHGEWLAILEAYGVQFLVLDVDRDGDLLQAVQSHPGWTMDFQDGEAMLFSRVQTYDSASTAP